MSMDLAERRARLLSDLELASQQRDRLTAAAQDAARQVEQFRGAIALIDELLRDGGPPGGNA
jgi:hypothetical protein